MVSRPGQGAGASRKRDTQLAAQDERDAEVERLALAASAARIGTFEWNLSSDRVLWTDQHALLMGVQDRPAAVTAVTPAALTSEHSYREWADRVHPEDLPRVEAEVSRCRAQHAPYECEYRVIWPDGSVHWIAGRGLFQYDTDGVAQRMLGMVMEITDRKQAEHALRELNATLEQRIADRTRELELSRRRSEAIVEAAFDAIVTIDHYGSIVTCNPSALRMFGYTAEELVGRALRSLLPSLRDDWVGIGGDEAGGDGRRLPPQKTGDFSAQRKDGTRFPVNVSFGLVADLGLGICIVRDVTEQHALQREILRISALEQQRLGQELHDGPLQELAGIGLLAESLSDALQDDATPARELATRLASELAAVNQSIRRLAEGLVPVAVDSAGLARALRALARMTERRHGLRCEVSMVGSLHKVDDDVAGHVYRIAREAVANVVKHADARSVHILLERGQDAIRLEVCDDGIGLQPERQESNGIGLRTMKYHCALMGGAFSVGPRARGGTRISCAIPVPEPTA